MPSVRQRVPCCSEAGADLRQVSTQPSSDHMAGKPPLNPGRSRWGPVAACSLERAQKVDDVLLLPGVELVELLDDLIRLAAMTPVGLERVDQVRRSPVMEEEDALPDAPERSGSELIGACGALGDAVFETAAHVVNEKIGVEVRGLAAECRARDRR